MNAARNALPPPLVKSAKSNEERSQNLQQAAAEAVNSSVRISAIGSTFQTLQALIGLAAFDVVLKLSGFRHVYEAVKVWPNAQKKCMDRTRMDQILSAVDRAGTYYPKPSLCLQRSAVITCLLRRAGLAAELVIGVRKMPFHGHAWVEVNGIVVNDNPKVQQFYSVLERC